MKEKKLPTVKKEQCTSKKLKYAGTQTFINKDTGELVEMNVTQITERDFNFTKIWMRHLVTSLELIGNQKLKVAFWIIEHLDRENRLICTTRKMANEIGCSLTTVTLTMRALQQSGFLQKIQSGVYMVDPDTVFKGSHNKRMALCMDYRSIEYEEPELSPEEEAEQLESQAKDMLNRAARLRGVNGNIIDAELDPQLNFNEAGETYQKAHVAETMKL